MADTLAGLSQAQAQAAWRKSLKRVSPEMFVPARDLYAGEAFRRGLAAADKIGCSFFVVSAGLGLVEEATPVPAYDLTVSPMAAESLKDHLRGSFVPTAWWEAIQQGPFASAVADLGRGKGRVVVALSRPYALLIGESLARLRPSVRQRVRLLGGGLESSLPTVLHPQIVRYDSRLDGFHPGTKLNFASRALAHFTRLVGNKPITSVLDDQSTVNRSLGKIEPPTVTSRQRLDDDALYGHIRSMIREGLSAQRALRVLRSDRQVACEERRFRRLYEEVAG